MAINLKPAESLTLADAGSTSFALRRRVLKRKKGEFKLLTWCFYLVEIF